jgi:nucleoside-triphosphatase THEP1
VVIVITGPIGIGKTTVCRKFIEIARRRGCTCGGIISYKTPDKSIIVEDIQTGHNKTLASIACIYQGPCTHMYFFNPDGIDFGIRAIDKGYYCNILIIDEIGQLELGGQGFVNAIEVIRGKKGNDIILVIRKELLSAFLPLLGAKPLIFETTIENRNELPNEIDTIISRNLGAKCRAALDVEAKQINDILPLANLSSLTELGLWWNQISDISPLVDNNGLSEGDEIYLQGNPLSSDSINIYIPQLEARGVVVTY